jgi:hypothetical protein
MSDRARHVDGLPTGDVRTANRRGKPDPDRKSMTRAILA